MHPKTVRQHIGNQQATSMREQPGFQRPQTRATMTTEYQERFLFPSCNKTITTRQRDPYHPLKGTKVDMSTFGSYYVTYKWVKSPPKVLQPPVPPQGKQRCSTAPHNHLRFLPNQEASKAVDYTTVYQNDFQAWTTNKRQPIKQHDCLKVKQGLVVTSEYCAKKNSVKVADNPEVLKPQPIESITSYRSDFITHPVQPRQRRKMPVYQPNIGLSLEPAESLRSKVTWEHFDRASEILQQFKSWSNETKFHGQSQAKASGPSGNYNMYLSTTHGDYTAHKCQRIKPVLPHLPTSETRKMLFQATTTMKEDYKAWDTPRRFPTGHKEELGWPKKSPMSECPPKPVENFKVKPEPFSLHSKWNETTVCNPSCNATEDPRCPAENGTFSGFECTTNGTGNPGGTGPPLGTKGDFCESTSEAHQIIGCVVSSRC